MTRNQQSCVFWPSLRLVQVFSAVKVIILHTINIVLIIFVGSDGVAPTVLWLKTITFQFPLSFFQVSNFSVSLSVQPQKPWQNPSAVRFRLWIYSKLVGRIGYRLKPLISRTPRTGNLSTSTWIVFKLLLWAVGAINLRSRQVRTTALLLQNVRRSLSTTTGVGVPIPSIAPRAKSSIGSDKVAKQVNPDCEESFLTF